MARFSPWGVALLLLMYGVASAQPPGYSSDTSVPMGGGGMKIGLMWGEQLQPAQMGMKAVSNLQRAASIAGLAVSEGGQTRISSADLSGYAVILVSADAQFQLSDTEKKKLRDFISSGGLIVLDNATPLKSQGAAEASLRQMAKDIAGSGKLKQIPSNHKIYNSPNMLGGPPIGSEIGMDKIVDMPAVNATSTRETEIAALLADEKTPSANRAALQVELSQIQSSKRARTDYMPSKESDTLEGAFQGDRLTILFSNKGYTARWSADSGSDPQMKFGINLIAYALSQKKASSR